MPLVSRELSNGLVLAEQSADEAVLSRALKEIDRRYILQKHPRDIEGGWVYKVFCLVSEDQPPIPILTWADDYGRPLPLSSGLIEEVKKWRPENRHRRGGSEDDHNRRLAEETEKLRHDQFEAINDDHRPYVERGRVSIALGARPRRWRPGGPPRSGSSA